MAASSIGRNLPDAFPTGDAASDLAHASSDRRWPIWLAVLPLLLGTLTSTLSNNIVNVPLRDIMQDLNVSLARGALVVISFTLTTAIMMPIAGWLADRLGRRKVYLWAVSMVGVASCGASLAPTLDVLVAFRVLQAMAAASTLPAAMGILTELYGIESRGRALGMWAASNGLGQAIGPPAGGLIAAWLSWRWIFTPTIVMSVLAAGIAFVVLPRDAGHAGTLDWRGAVTLSGGAGLVMAGAGAVPQVGVRSPLVIALVASGLGVLVLFRRTMRRAVAPFVDPELFCEFSFIRSTVAVFTQMFCLGATLLAVPLYLTRTLGRSTTTAGLIVFAFPAALTFVAPFAGRAAMGARTHWILRLGLLILLIAQVLMAAALSWLTPHNWTIVSVLVVGGAGTALVQAPAATGATRSRWGAVAQVLACSIWRASPGPRSAPPGSRSRSPAPTITDYCSSSALRSPASGWRPPGRDPGHGSRPLRWAQHDDGLRR